MSTLTGDNEMIPLVLGVSVVAIILVAFFSNRDEGDKKKAVAASASATTAAATSKKSKKKKPSSLSSSKAKAKQAAEKEVVIRDPTPPPVAVEPEPEPEPVAEAAEKKKKRKPKKKSTTTADPDATPTLPPPSSTKNGSSEENDDSDDDDDDVELWRIQLAAKKGKGGVVAIDAAKRAAANKERDRVRAIRRQEEKAKAEARAIAEEEMIRAEERAVAEAALAAMAEEKKRVEEGSAKAKKNGNGASAQAGANGKAVAFANDASATTASNGNADVNVAEKKKRKRNKKKGGASGVPESRPPLVKPAASPSVEHWEVVPMVEEWQEVNIKKTKPKSAPSLNVVPAGYAGVGEEVAPLIMDEPAEEQAGETSVTISAGDDPLIIIGKGGATIQKLQETTGAKFRLNRSTNILTITGIEDAVQLGLAAAQAILAAEAERKAAEVEESVTWGSDAIKAVIGRGGANIRAAQEATGTSIDADVDAGTLTIVGPADRVSIALTMCHNAAYGEVQDVLELGSRNAVNLVYGPNFQTIRTLQESTGCKLDIARGGTTLKLAGSTEAVAGARAQILALLEMNRGFEMTIEISKVGAVYGKGGETLRTIQDRTGTQIDVARGPTHATVSVMGTLEATGRARNMLQRAIDGEVELRPGEVAEEIELGSATAAVIGRGGSNVVELEKKHGVKVNVRSEFQKARVVGKPERVEAAVKEIAAIVKPILAAKNAQKKADDELKTGESAWVAENLAADVEGW
jgi:rRNA processing protein Krr1/Pno1